MASVTPPPGAEQLEEWPKASNLNKLSACLVALGMDTSMWRLGGGQLVVLGVREELLLAVEARFDLGETPTGKLSVKFAGAKVLDPIGVIRNVEFDYSINKPNAKRLGLTPENAKKLGDARNREYNDGGQQRLNIADFATSGELNEWLDEWLGVLKVDHKQQSAKKRATKAEKNELAILTGGTWEA